MNFVEVRHDGCDKRYWFELGHGLKVDRNDRVLCDTVQGYVLGTVTRVLLGLSEDEFEALFYFYPTRKVIGVYMAVLLEDIEIPFSFRSAIPATKRIARRVDEYREWAYADDIAAPFKTNVEINTFNTLKDGYTAYLVAKMFGRPWLACLVTVGDKVHGKNLKVERASADD